MIRIFVPAGVALLLSFYLSGCSGDEKKLQAECAKPTGGAACNKLGLKRKGQEALQFFRAGCQKQDSDSCMSLASRTPDPGEAKRVLTEACDRQSPAACNKLGVPLKSAAKPDAANGTTAGKTGGPNGGNPDGTGDGKNSGGTNGGNGGKTAGKTGGPNGGKGDKPDGTGSAGTVGIPPPLTKTLTKQTTYVPDPVTKPKEKPKGDDEYYSETAGRMLKRKKGTFLKDK